jgi:hypothetical protein
MFCQPKIVYPGETKNNKFGLCESTSGYSGARVFSITLNNFEKLSILELLGLLNSTLIEFYLHRVSSVKAGGYFSYSSQQLNSIPIPDKTPSGLEALVDEIIQLTKNIYTSSSSFLTYLQSQFGVEKWSKKMQQWYTLEFGEFISELNKAAKKHAKEQGTDYTALTKTQEFEYMEFFTTKKAEAQALQAEINQTDKAIDAMVYELYGLSEEEIEIVEGS